MHVRPFHPPSYFGTCIQDSVLCVLIYAPASPSLVLPQLSKQPYVRWPLLMKYSVLRKVAMGTDTTENGYLRRKAEHSIMSKAACSSVR